MPPRRRVRGRCSVGFEARQRCDVTVSRRIGNWRLSQGDRDEPHGDHHHRGI